MGTGSSDRIMEWKGRLWKKSRGRRWVSKLFKIPGNRIGGDGFVVFKKINHFQSCNSFIFTNNPPIRFAIVFSGSDRRTWQSEFVMQKVTLLPEFTPTRFLKLSTKLSFVAKFAITCPQFFDIMSKRTGMFGIFAFEPLQFEIAHFCLLQHLKVELIGLGISSFSFHILFVAVVCGEAENFRLVNPHEDQTTSVNQSRPPIAFSFAPVMGVCVTCGLPPRVSPDPLHSSISAVAAAAPDASSSADATACANAHGISVGASDRKSPNAHRQRDVAFDSVPLKLLAIPLISAAVELPVCMKPASAPSGTTALIAAMPSRSANHTDITHHDLDGLVELYSSLCPAART